MRPLVGRVVSLGSTPRPSLLAWLECRERQARSSEWSGEWSGERSGERDDGSAEGAKSGCDCTRAWTGGAETPPPLAAPRRMQVRRRSDAVEGARWRMESDARIIAMYAEVSKREEATGAEEHKRPTNHASQTLHRQRRVRYILPDARRNEESARES